MLNHRMKNMGEMHFYLPLLQPFLGLSTSIFLSYDFGLPNFQHPFFPVELKFWLFLVYFMYFAPPRPPPMNWLKIFPLSEILYLLFKGSKRNSSHPLRLSNFWMKVFTITLHVKVFSIISKWYWFNIKLATNFRLLRQ